MARSIWVSTLAVLFVSSNGIAVDAQENQKQSAQLFENPFARQPQAGSASEGERSEKQQDAAEQASSALENLFPNYAGDKVKELLRKNPADDKVRSLRKARCNAAIVEVEARLAEFRGGRSPVSVVLQSSNRLASSLLALEPDKSTRMAILKSCLEIAQDIEKFANLNLRNGTGTRQEVAQAKYERLGAEILLEKAKAGLKKKDGSVSD